MTSFMPKKIAKFAAKQAAKRTGKAAKAAARKAERGAAQSVCQALRKIKNLGRSTAKRTGEISAEALEQLNVLFRKVAAMSDAAWGKMLEGIARSAAWAYGKDGDRLADMRRETFFRKTRSYMAGLDPAAQLGLITALILIAGSAAAAAMSAGAFAPVTAASSMAYMLTAQGRGFVNHLAAPDPGYIYIMQAEMPDGKDIKGGQTTRSPEIRAAELSRERGADFQVIASKEVPDVDHAEEELLQFFRENLGEPSVGREQWDLDIDLDPLPALAAIEGGPVIPPDADGGGKDAAPDAS